MTFQPKLDVWEAEGLRTSAGVQPLSARDAVRLIIRTMSRQAIQMTLTTVASSGPFRCPGAAWTRACREMLARNIGWAAIRFATASGVLFEVRGRLTPPTAGLRAAEPLNAPAHGQEVDDVPASL